MMCLLAAYTNGVFPSESHSVASCTFDISWREYPPEDLGKLFPMKNIFRTSGSSSSFAEGTPDSLHGSISVSFETVDSKDTVRIAPLPLRPSFVVSGRVTVVSWFIWLNKQEHVKIMRSCVI